MPQTFQLNPVGVVHNNAVPSNLPGIIKQQMSCIEISEDYAIGLKGIEAHQWLTVVFGLDRIEEVHLTEPRYNGEHYGIFACRSQYRPNRLGVTTCRLHRIDGRNLWVDGLDAADGSPVFDLKCPDTSEQDMQHIHDTVLRSDPRHDIAYAIRNKLPYLLWLKAGQLTGKLSPQLALGVMAALHFLDQCRRRHTYGEHLYLQAPLGNPITDGALFVAGISPSSGHLLLQHQDDMPTLRFSCSLFTVVYILSNYPDVDEPVESWITSDPEYFFGITHIECV